jgi:hypothetical protein
MISAGGKSFVVRPGGDFGPGARLLRIDGRSALVEVAGQKVTLKL